MEEARTLNKDKLTHSYGFSVKNAGYFHYHPPLMVCNGRESSFPTLKMNGMSYTSNTIISFGF